MVTRISQPNPILMKKIMPFIVFLCCFGTVLHAQLDTFDLSLYRLPDIKFRQLDLGFNIGGSNIFNKNNGENYSSKYSSFTSNSNLNIAYRSYRNSEHLQNEQQFSIGLTPEFKNEKTDDELTYKYSNFNSVLQFKSDNRFYRQNQFFFETDFHIYGSGNWRKTDDKTEYTLTKSDDVSAEIEIPLLIGHGRIEQIQDARLAIYIFEELQKAGRISKMPGNEDILEFSRLISTLKNERYFDYRIKKMQEIEKVDSFLQAKGFVTTADARYFTIVNDNWDYAQGPVRESGKRLSGGLVPNFSYSNNRIETTYSSPDDTSEQKIIQKNLGIKMQASYVIEKPVNLHWQRSMSVTIAYGYDKDLNTSKLSENPETKSDFGQMELEAGINYGMGYYPNSRTEITGLVSLDFHQAGRKDNLDQPLEKINTYGVEPKFALDLHYYISPQFRLNIFYNIYYYYTNNHYKYDNDDESYYFKFNALTQSFNAGFTYSFF
jgi:hypothetical protein